MRYHGKGAHPFVLYTAEGAAGPTVPADMARFEVDRPIALTVCAMHETEYGQRGYVMEETVLVDRDGPAAQTHVASVEVTPLDDRPFQPMSPVDDATLDVVRDVCQRNTAWYKDGRLRPHAHVLRRVQIPRYNGFELPGWAFMMTSPSPRAAEAGVVEHALRRVAFRRALPDLTAEAFAQLEPRERIVLVAETLQAVANHIVYAGDKRASESGLLVETDQFSDLARFIGAGDCEVRARPALAVAPAGGAHQPRARARRTAPRR